MLPLKSPLEFSLYIEILLYMLILVAILFFTNLILVGAKLEETFIYKRFEAFVGLYVKLFSVILLLTIIWIILAAITKYVV